MKSVVGVWCGAGTGALLAEVHGRPLIRITLDRIGPCIALVPWGELGIAAELKSWGIRQRSSHPNKMIAMRDLITETEAEVGILVDGTCAVIDKAEIKLAVALKRYESVRVLALRSEEWLNSLEQDEWVEPMDAKRLAQFYAPGKLDASAREIKARRATD